jgi:hypothetical protein
VLCVLRVPRRAQEEGMVQLLMDPGRLASSIPGISGTRNLSDNLSDLKAQVKAASREGMSAEHSIHALHCEHAPPGIPNLLLPYLPAWWHRSIRHTPPRPPASCRVAHQVAANTCGIGLVGDLIREYGLRTVVAYMHHIQVRHPQAAVQDRHVLVEAASCEGLPGGRDAQQWARRS